MKPRVFVGSSVENVDCVYAVQEQLDDDADVTPWTDGVFEPSEHVLESLTAQLAVSDFGLFICCPEDVTTSKGEEQQKVRDNVIFELGMYVGHLGRDRSFLLVPNDAEDGFLPTDLLGITPARFKRNRSQATSEIDIGAACAKIRRQIKKLGRKMDNHVHTATLEQLAVAVDELKLLLANDKFNALSYDQKVTLAYERAHGHAQTLVSREWGNEHVVVSLKVPDPDEPKKKLRCHYLRDRLPPRRLRPSMLTPLPETIPIEGSVAGEVYRSGKSKCVGNISNADLDKELLDEVEGVIGSVLACPIRLDGEVVGVVKFDAETAGFFTAKDRRVQAISRAVVSCFEMAFRVGSLPMVPPKKLKKAEKAERKSTSRK